MSWSHLIDENKDLKQINAELLEALKAFVNHDYQSSGYDEDRDLLRMCRAAIAKAEGRS